ncbi:RNA polymerase sigma factor, sigma-70 family [Algoriphagus locisalis]|uniref:RNA polymerase sigma factor, sigma-70 family n=1 Tax=Algoriphagus locisalis TaxID=305507 RepID=A0A1I7E8B3_9BACT|nr:sigma-70 family RNA polymerase sigma factor [Algoriphagus locisalis]SFU20188.1 RNA polymerase sigma factor, sigma-70 family [Algoriphagus locisalis]
MNKEERFVQDIRKGDKEKLEKIYSDNRDHFLTFARKYQLHDEQIKDIYQESIIVFYENILDGKLVTLQSSIKTYLFAIGKYKLIQYLRKEEKYDVFPFEEKDLLDHISIQEMPSEEELDGKTAVLRTGLRQLGPKCQEVLRMFYYEGKKLEEIQMQLGYESKDTVKSQKSRCIRQLKKLVGAYEK